MCIAKVFFLSILCVLALSTLGLIIGDVVVPLIAGCLFVGIGSFAVMVLRG